MMKHFKYLNYVIRHKWFVFQACVKIAKRYRKPLLIWRGIIHDWQKFTPAEWRPYVLSFYGPWKYKDRPEWLVADFDRAWLHHQHYGPHHWQYWLLQEDDGDLKAVEMPYAYTLEMLADWSGAGKAIKNKADPYDWYMDNKEKIILHPTTRLRVEGMMMDNLFR